MYINPILFGVLATIMTEITVLMIFAIVKSKRK